MGNIFLSELRKVLTATVNEIIDNQSTSSSTPEPVPAPEPEPVPAPAADEPAREYTKEEIAAFHQSHPNAKLIVEDVFTISGRGTVVCGMTKVPVALQDMVTIYRPDGSQCPSRITGITQFREDKDKVGAGENVGLILRGLERSEVSRNDVLE